MEYISTDCVLCTSSVCMPIFENSVDTYLVKLSYT